MDNKLEIPSLEELEQELLRSRRSQRRKNGFAGSLCILATLVAAAILVGTLFLPVVQVYGTAMTPTFSPDDVLLAVPAREYAPGDLIAFYHNNTIQIRRIIAGPGSMVELDVWGNVTVDSAVFPLPTGAEAAPGQCDITLPYRVPDGCFFVIGDNRADSIDSRSSVMGCVGADRIIGKILLRVFPAERFGLISNGN